MPIVVLLKAGIGARYQRLLERRTGGDPAAMAAEDRTHTIRAHAALEDVDHKASAAQREAGNYRKHHTRFQGLEVTIENPRGSIRRGVDRGGHRWAATMAHDYGYICGTLGVDGDHFDVLLGPNPTAPTAYIVTTMAPPAFDQVDEQKGLLGFNSEEEARAAFHGMYDDPRFLGELVAMPMDEFKAKVRTTLERPRLLKGCLLFLGGEASPAPRVLFLKANPNHDARGRFARAPETGSGQGGGDDLASFLSGKATGVRVVADLPADIQAHLGAETDKVILSAETRDSHGHHQWTAESFAHLQAVLDLGEVRADRENHVIVAHSDGQWWYAVVKVTRDRKEVFLQSFHRSNIDQIKRFKERGTVVRESR